MPQLPVDLSAQFTAQRVPGMTQELTTCGPRVGEGTTRANQGPVRSKPGPVKSEEMRSGGETRTPNLAGPRTKILNSINLNNPS